MCIKLGDSYRVKLKLQFKCKRCGKEYYRTEESLQPSKEHIDKFIEYYLDKVKNNPYEYYHLCDTFPNIHRDQGKMKELHNYSTSLEAKYGVGEFLGFNIASSIYDYLGEG